MEPSSLTCPDCKLALAAVTSGSVVAHRCGRCRGIWLDPESFRRLCEEEARPPDDDAAIVTSRGQPPRRAPAARDEPVRYRACPVCHDLMNRSNFARVSGVVIDVCRPHGAWLDRGELAAIRRFLGEGGLRRFERRSMEQRSPSTAARPIPKDPSLDDVYDVLVGGDGGWDVPSRIPRLLVAAFFGALGGWLLWRAFHPRTYDRSYGAGYVVGAVCSLYFALRALGQWVERRRRRTQQPEPRA